MVSNEHPRPSLPIAILRGVCSSIADWLSQRRQSDSGKRGAGLPTQAIDSCLREAGLTINELDHIAVNRISSLANATRAINASSRRSLVGFELAAPCYRPGFLSGVDKAAARTGALWDDILYMARVGHRTGNKIAAHVFLDLCERT